MNTLSKRHMKKRINQHEDHVAGSNADMLITLGMYLTEVALANDKKDPYGKKRLARVEAGVHALCKVEVVQGAERFTKNYTHNLGHGFARALDRLDQIYGEGHTAGMREWLKKVGLG